MIKDYYSILELPSNASDAEIKSTYRSKARKYHPDVNSSLDATEIMQLINEAYFILNDPHKRSAYDREYSIYSNWKKERQKPPPRPEPTPEPPPKEEFVDEDYSVHDEQLNDWMKEAAEAAKEIFRQVKSDTKGMAKAAGAEMGKYLVIGLVLAIIGFIALMTINATSRTQITQESPTNKTSLPQKKVLSSTEPVPTGWNLVRIENLCSFHLPPTLELQGGGYRKMMDNFQESLCYILEYDYDQDRIVSQPKGINDLDKEALGHYCRFIVETFSVSPLEPLPTLSEPLGLTRQELAEMNTGFRQEILAEFATAKSQTGMTMELVEWYPLQVCKLKNADALEYGFLRKSSVKNKAPVSVKYYLIFNRIKGHKVTVSYRTDEKERWESTLNKMLSTLEFKEL